MGTQLHEKPNNRPKARDQRQKQVQGMVALALIVYVEGLPVADVAMPHAL